jgi:hypothetical protein
LTLTNKKSKTIKTDLTQRKIGVPSTAPNRWSITN